ncbi:hypothetical protein K438DRAFT_1747088 [Mycena galopus ATCC 62051]|nr:hypothetical protein K438DRAFT_1747088 [Mycena galopus ATCC 62051]
MTDGFCNDGRHERFHFHVLAPEEVFEKPQPHLQTKSAQTQNLADAARMRIANARLEAGHQTRGRSGWDLRRRCRPYRGMWLLNVNSIFGSHFHQWPETAPLTVFHFRVIARRVPSSAAILLKLYIGQWANEPSRFVSAARDPLLVDTVTNPTRLGQAGSQHENLVHGKTGN